MTRELDDRGINRCLMCGAWVNKLDLCTLCFRVYEARHVQKYRDKWMREVLKRA